MRLVRVSSLRDLIKTDAKILFALSWSRSLATFPFLYSYVQFMCILHCLNLDTFRNCVPPKQSGAIINISDGSCPERIVTVSGSTTAIFKAFSLITKKFEEVRTITKRANDALFVY